jgi:hypothetical protein
MFSLNSNLTQRLYLAVGLVVAACHGGNEPNTSTDTVGSVAGVRADVREYIESEFSSEYERKAALQFAAALQGELDAAPNKDLLTKLAEDSFKAMDCMYYVFPNTKSFPGHAKAFAAQNEIQARTFNTKERSLTRVRNSKLLSGSIWRARNESEFPGRCNFDLKGFTPTVLP